MPYSEAEEGLQRLGGRLWHAMRAGLLRIVPFIGTGSAYSHLQEDTGMECSCRNCQPWLCVAVMMLCAITASEAS